MHPKLAPIYLATLADAIARHNRISPATDDTRLHHAVGALDRLAELLLATVRLRRWTTRRTLSST
jgi:predicted hydrolase (HD superfamily)